MSIQVSCIQCGASHQVNVNMSGRRVRCPQCDTVVHVPEADAVVLDQSASGSAGQPVEPLMDVEIVDDDQDDETVELVEAIEVKPLSTTRPIHVTAVEKVSPAEPVETHVVVLDGDEDDQPVLKRSHRIEEEIDMTPMVDVTFLLLIFFMVTAAFSLQKSIEMPRQQTDQPSANVEEEVDEMDVVEVQVDEYGSFLVMAPNFERETPGKQNLTTALREAIAGDRDGMRLDIKVHEMAKLRALVDAMDAGTIAGYSELQVTQVEEFD